MAITKPIVKMVRIEKDVSIIVSMATKVNAMIKALADISETYCTEFKSFQKSSDT